ARRTARHHRGVRVETPAVAVGGAGVAALPALAIRANPTVAHLAARAAIVPIVVRIGLAARRGGAVEKAWRAGARARLGAAPKTVAVGRRRPRAARGVWAAPRERIRGIGANAATRPRAARGHVSFVRAIVRPSAVGAPVVRAFVEAKRLETGEAGAA